ncbi:MAG TPA: hypothetical protein ENN03_06985, partial [bacterium]|nr:hypothetical protein [bacterium]
MKQDSSIRRLASQLNWITVGIGFGLLYWILEAIRDALLRNTALFKELLFPEPMTFWMRILLVWVLILFGSYAQSFKP